MRGDTGESDFQVRHDEESLKKFIIPDGCGIRTHDPKKNMVCRRRHLFVEGLVGYYFNSPFDHLQKVNQ